MLVLITCVFLTIGARVVDGLTPAATDVGWYILGENQQNLGPYTFSELCGKSFM